MGAFLLVLVAAALLACGARPPVGDSRQAGDATVRGRVFCPASQTAPADCPPLDDLPVNFSSPPESSPFAHHSATTGPGGAYSIRLPAGTYVVVAGRADRSIPERRVTVKAGDVVTLDLPLTPPTG